MGDPIVVDISTNVRGTLSGTIAWGDGTTSPLPNNGSVQHRYAAAQPLASITATARGTLRDADGNAYPCSNGALPLAQYKVVWNLTPKITVRNLGNNTYQFDASASGPSGKVSSYIWDYGDGQRGSGRVVQHRFYANHSVLLTISAGDGYSKTAQARVTYSAAAAATAAEAAKTGGGVNPVAAAVAGGLLLAGAAIGAMTVRARALQKPAVDAVSTQAKAVLDGKMPAPLAGITTFAQNMWRRESAVGKQVTDSKGPAPTDVYEQIDSFTQITESHSTFLQRSGGLIGETGKNFAKSAIEINPAIQFSDPPPEDPKATP